MTQPILNRTREHGDWFLHYNDEFAGDVLIRHKEDDHLQVKIPFEALRELVAEASLKARVELVPLGSLEPVKINLPGQRGFKINITKDSTVVTHDGKSVNVKAGDQVEWDGQKLVVVRGGQNG